MADIKLSPEAWGKIVEVGVALVLNGIAKHQERPTGGLTEEQVLARVERLREGLRGEESTPEIIARVRRERED